MHTAVGGNSRIESKLRFEKQSFIEFSKSCDSEFLVLFQIPIANSHAQIWIGRAWNNLPNADFLTCGMWVGQGRVVKFNGSEMHK